MSSSQAEAAESAESAESPVSAESTVSPREPRPLVSVIGVGAMGLPLATRLASKFAVVVYDAAIANAERARSAGVLVAGTAAKATEGVRIVVVAVRTLEQVEEALLGEDGAARSLAPSSVVVLTSTVGVDGARRVGARLGELGVELLDLPVSGGPVRASQGTLLAFAGGSEAAIAAARPVLDLLASSLVVVGPSPGDGQAMKTVNQLLCGVHIAAAAEALVLARGLGLDPRWTLQALEAGAAASFMLSNRGPRIVEALEGGSPEVLSRVDIFVKDLGIVAGAGRDAGVALPVAAATEQLFRLGAIGGLAGADDSSIATLLGEGLRDGRSGEGP